MNIFGSMFRLVIMNIFHYFSTFSFEWPKNSSPFLRIALHGLRLLVLHYKTQLKASSIRPKKKKKKKEKKN